MKPRGAGAALSENHRPRFEQAIDLGEGQRALLYRARFRSARSVADQRAGGMFCSIG